MKTIAHTLSALVAGAFLAIGFEALAEKYDPLANPDVQVIETELASLPPCTLPCEVPDEGLARTV